MILTLILKLFSSLSLSCTFQMNAGCLSAGPLALDTTCAAFSACGWAYDNHTSVCVLTTDLLDSW